MNLKDKIIVTGLAGVISLGTAGMVKGAVTDYQISKNAVVSKHWETAQGFGQHYAGAFDDNHDGKIDRILVRNAYFGAKAVVVGSEEVLPENPRFNDLLQRINKK